MNDFQPIRLLEVELSRPVPEIAPYDPQTGRIYGRALVLVRLHADPLGVVDVALDGVVDPSCLAGEIWRRLRHHIDAHLRSDEIAQVRAVPTEGLSAAGRCLAERDRHLRKAPPVSVVVCTRNRPDVLARSLHSFKSLAGLPYELIVVDSASDDDATAEVVRRLDYPAPVRYVREVVPGLSRARNRGVAEATGEIIAFTDDDVVVDRHWLAGLARGFGRADRIGCVTGLVMPLELETQSQLWFEEFGGFGKGFVPALFDANGNRPNDPLFPYAAGRFGSGNNMAFRRDVLLEIGCFDLALGAGSPTRGGEDLAAFVAVLRKGYRLAYEPSAIVHHQHRRDYEGLRKHIYDCGVGLTAYLAKTVIDHPRSALDFAAKIPRGWRYASSPTSPKNRKKSASYPPELTAIERRGMLRGPFAYLSARLFARLKQRQEQGRLVAGQEQIAIPHHRETSGPIEDMRSNEWALDTSFQPIRLLEVELSETIPPIDPVEPATGRIFRRAASLVRLHSQPLGLLWLDLDEDGLRPEQYEQCIYAALRSEIQEHLRGDCLGSIHSARQDGWRSSPPLCLVERARAMANPTFVSVVVPTHDRPVYIAACLASLVGLEYPRYEVIVVDNAPSSDATELVVRGFSTALPQLRYVREERPGASWARNRGLLEAQGDIVSFTDDDVVVDRFWLADVVKAFQLADRVGCVTGNVLPQRLDTPAQVWIEQRGGFSRGFRRTIYDRSENVPDHPWYPFGAMIFGSGNNMSFRASALRDVGGFDPALDPSSPSRGGEDLAAFFEVIVRNYRLVYEPSAIVRHLHRADYLALERQMYGWGAGFAAFLTRSLVAHPALLPAFLAKLPRALGAFLDGSVPYRREASRVSLASLPSASSEALRQTERLGYLHGAFAYFLSRRRARRLTKVLGSLPVEFGRG